MTFSPHSCRTPLQPTRDTAVAANGAGTEDHTRHGNPNVAANVAANEDDAANNAANVAAIVADKRRRGRHQSIAMPRGAEGQRAPVAASLGLSGVSTGPKGT